MGLVLQGVQSGLLEFRLSHDVAPFLQVRSSPSTALIYTEAEKTQVVNKLTTNIDILGVGVGLKNFEELLSS